MNLNSRDNSSVTNGDSASPMDDPSSIKNKINRHQRLGQILINARRLSPEQLNRALTLQKETHQRLGQVLVNQEFISDKEIAECLSSQLNFPLVDLNLYPPNPLTLSAVSRDIASRYMVFPINVEGQRVTLAMADPLNILAEDAVRKFSGMDVKPVVAPESQVLEFILRYYSEESEAYGMLEQITPDFQGEEISLEEVQANPNELLRTSGFESVVGIVKAILANAVRRGASDIHLEPYEQTIRLRYRVDGRLRQISVLPRQVYPAIVSRFKILANLDIAESRRPQDGSFKAMIGHRSFSFRLSTLRTHYGEKIVLRILDNFMQKVNLDGLGLLKKDTERLENIILQPQGLILVTGPTGSGKTTTLYAALNRLRADEINIVTVEDPIEYQLSGINQVQVDEKAGVSFSNLLRTILRQDPNVIMIGEIRDRETLEIAIRASLTGHLVLATLHTNNARSTPTRLLDMGVEGYLLASSLIGILAQRLVRRLCPECSQPVKRPVGCQACSFNGYLGRVGIYELMIVEDEVRRAIQLGDEDKIEEVARRHGYRRMEEDAEEKIQMGWTTSKQVSLVVSSESETPEPDLSFIDVAPKPILESEATAPPLFNDVPVNGAGATPFLIEAATESNSELSDELSFMRALTAPSPKPEETASRVADEASTPRPIEAIAESAERRNDPPLPAAPSEDAPANHESHLPPHFTPFFGREAELKRLHHLILQDQARLITLTGPAGCGKSRLAIETAERLVKYFNGRVYFAPLADINDPQLISAALLETLDIPLSRAAKPLDQATEALSDKPTLLVLDNFEHLIDGGAEVLLSLLSRCPNLFCIITSRHILNVTGEREASVRPLPTPEESASLDELLKNDSIRLFVDRARAANPSFKLDQSNASAVAQICARLEGNPLAIELAAARSRIFQPAQLLEHLKRRFDILVSNKRDIPERHRTLRAAIDWSFQLLTPDLQRFLTRLSIFRGGWTTTAAEWVCEDPSAMENLERLRESSLLAMETKKGIPLLVVKDSEKRSDSVEWKIGEEETLQWSLFETLREYAAERLEETGETERLQLRLNKYLTSIAYFAQSEMGTVWTEGMLRWHDAFQENIRESLEWCLENQPNLALRLAGLLGVFWLYRGNIDEGRDWLARSLERSVNPPDRWRIRGLRHAGDLAVYQGDYEAGIRYLKGAVALGRKAFAVIEDWEEKRYVGGAIGDSLSDLGAVSLRKGDYKSARSYLGISLKVFQEIKSEGSMAKVIGFLGELAETNGNYIEARIYYQESANILKETEDFIQSEKTLTYRRLGDIALLLGELDKSRDLYEESLSLAEEIEDRSGIASALMGLGSLAFERENYEEAETNYRKCLTIWRNYGNKREIALALRRMSRTEAERGAGEKAAELFGASEGLREKLGVQLPLHERKSDERSLEKIRSRIGDATWKKAFIDGKRLHWQRAIAYALNETESP